jgi:D-glycerate 3-kinase
LTGSSKAALNRVEAAVMTWLNDARRPLVLGICGAQGSGKSTLALKLAKRLNAQGLATASLSLDDLYLSREARARLAAAVHPLFVTRGVPGTHDIALGERVFDNLLEGLPTRLPRFDKASDAPCPEDKWEVVDGPVDVVIFEGWCVGAVPQAAASLIGTVNALEAARDGDGVWRRHVNDALAGPYAHLFARLDRLVLLAAPGFEIVRNWRTQQEHGLAKRTRAAGRTAHHIMSDAEVAFFIQHYERLTRHILSEMPARADLTLRLDRHRRVV